MIATAPHGAIYVDPTWVAGARSVVFTRDESAGKPRYALYVLRLGERTPRRLRVSYDPVCPYVATGRAVAVSASSVAYLAQCFGDERRAYEGAVAAMVYDLKSGKTRRLLAYDLPLFTNSLTAAWDLRVAIVDNDNGLKQQLFRLRKSGPERLAFPSFRSMGPPALTPDGGTLALFAVTTAAAKTRWQALNAYGNLYMIDVRTGRVKILLHDVKTDAPGAWSSDQRWLILPLSPKWGPGGLWLVDVQTGKPYLLRAGDDFGTATWLDTKTVVVAVGIYAQEPQLAKKRSPAGLAEFRLPDLATLRRSR